MKKLRDSDYEDGGDRRSMYNTVGNDDRCLSDGSKSRSRSRSRIRSRSRSRSRSTSRSSSSSTSTSNSRSSSSSESDSDTKPTKKSKSYKRDKKNKKKKKKARRKSKKRKKKYKKKEKKRTKKKRMTEKNDDDEDGLQTAVDALDSSSTSVDAAVSQHNLLDKEKTDVSLLHTDFESRAAALNLPKGLIRTTSATSGSGLFSGSGQFGTKSSRKDLRGLGINADNPATQARLKREHQAQRAEKRARQILEERRKAAAVGQAVDGEGADRSRLLGLGILKNRFSSGGSIQN